MFGIQMVTVMDHLMNMDYLNAWVVVIQISTVHLQPVNDLNTRLNTPFTDAFAHISKREHPNIEAIKLIVSCVECSKGCVQYPKIINKL